MLNPPDRCNTTTRCTASSCGNGWRIGPRPRGSELGVLYYPFHLQESTEGRVRQPPDPGRTVEEAAIHIRGEASAEARA